MLSHLNAFFIYTRINTELFFSYSTYRYTCMCLFTNQGPSGSRACAKLYIAIYMNNDKQGSLNTGSTKVCSCRSSSVAPGLQGMVAAQSFRLANLYSKYSIKCALIHYIPLLNIQHIYFLL